MEIAAISERALHSSLWKGSCLGRFRTGSDWWWWCCKLSTYVLIAEPLHTAVEEAGLANGYGQVARHIKVEVGQQIRGRDCGGRCRGRRRGNRSAVA